MWHEARRRERATQKLFSDHKKRAEKRREENKIDPSSLLQIHGVKSKIHIDLNTHKQAANSMVIWQGDQKTTIDRFDVRTTLSALPTEEKPSIRQTNLNENERRRKPSVLDSKESEHMKKLLNFERYRLLMQNDLKGISEATRLSLVEKKNHLLSDAKMRKLQNNWFGTSGETSFSNEHAVIKNLSNEARTQGVAIGFDYNVLSSADADDEPQISFPNNVAMPDFDDCDTELDLDCVDKVTKDLLNKSKVVDLYGLNCDEFNMLAESTSRTAKEVIHKLKQFSTEIRQDCKTNKSTSIKQQEYYGPALPPDMLKGGTSISTDQSNEYRSTKQDQTKSSAATCLESSSGCRSPESLPDQGFESQQSKETVSSKESVLVQSKQSTSAYATSQNLATSVQMSASSSKVHSDQRSYQSANDSKVSKSMPPIQINLKTNKERDDIVDSQEQAPGRERRAVTPLAYKRYCRSDRSLSRDRSSGRHRSRYSSTSSSDTTSSHSSRSSSTSDSSSGRSRRKSRHRAPRIRSRSRSPGYGRSHRNSYKYYKRERR